MSLQQNLERRNWFHSCSCHLVLLGAREQEIKSSEFRINFHAHALSSVELDVQFFNTRNSCSETGLKQKRKRGRLFDADYVDYSSFPANNQDDSSDDSGDADQSYDESWCYQLRKTLKSDRRIMLESIVAKVWIANEHSHVSAS